jgi:hypothetical protein
MPGVDDVFGQYHPFATDDAATAGDSAADTDHDFLTRRPMRRGLGGPTLSRRAIRNSRSGGSLRFLTGLAMRAAPF